MRPLATVDKTAAAIAAGDLSRRVDVDNAHIKTAFTARKASEAKMRGSPPTRPTNPNPLVTIRGFSELYRHGAMKTSEDDRHGPDR